jgi:hypothetical protein
MLVELSIEEIIFIRSAVREYRTVAPKHIEDSHSRLGRWLEERELYDGSRSSVDNKMTNILANEVNKCLQS